MGDGPLAVAVREFCSNEEWCRWLGALRGEDRVAVLGLGDVWLNPGTVGLSILDSFALGLPLITTRNAIHSPEIAYLRPGENGVISEPRIEDYARATADVLLDPTTLRRLSRGAWQDGLLHSADDMACRFVEGIVRCLRAE